MIEAQDRASAALNAVAASLGRLEQQAGRTSTSLPKIATGMALGTVAAHAFMGAAQAVVGSLAGMGKGAVDLASRLEQAKIGFTTMLGGAQQADAFIRKLQAFAEGTAFSFPGIQQAAQNFLAMGVEGKNVIPIIQDITNALAAAGKGGDTAALQRVGASLAEIQAQGKVTGEQLRELARNGIAVLPMLAAAFGKTTAEVRKMAEENEISSEMFFEAFHSQVAQRYGDIQAEQAKTWAVAITNVQDILGRMTTETLSEFFGALTQGALLLQDFLKSDNARQWAADMKASIHDVMTLLAPLGAALRSAMGLGDGGAAATASKFKAPPNTFAKANWQDTAIPPAVIQSAKDYSAEIANATVNIHAATAELTGLTAQQDALKIKIAETTKHYELQLTGLKDQQEALNLDIEKTKTHWESVIVPLEKTGAALKRLEEDTKNDFQGIMDPLKTSLDAVNRKIQDTKTGYESVVRPIQSQIDAIDKANSALTKQLNLVNEIADLALRQKALNALGDPNLRASIASRLKMLDLNRDDLERQKQLIELSTKKGNVEKATAGIQKQLDANTRERLALEQKLANAADKGLLAQVAGQEVLNGVKREQTEIDLANARMAADAAKAPLVDQVADLKAQLDKTMVTLEAQASALSRSIENTARAEAAALAPIVAAQESVSRQIEDANAAMESAIAPLEAAHKALTAQIAEAEKAQRDALAPLQEQTAELDRQRDRLELKKKQIQDQIAAWKDETEAIKERNAEEAKKPKPLDLTGGAEPPDLPAALTGKSLIPPGMIEDVKTLATQVQAATDALNNLNATISGGMIGQLGELAKIIGAYAVSSVVVGGLMRLAPAIAGLANPAGIAVLALTGLLLFIEKLPEMQAELAKFWDQYDQRNAEERTKDMADWDAHYATRKTNFDKFWTGLLPSVTAWWTSLGTKTAEEQAADKAAWAAHQAAQKAAHDKYWADLINPVTAWWTSLGSKTAEQQAADKAAWEAHQTARTESWNKFWDGLAAKVAAWKLDWTAGWLKIWADWDRDWAKIVNAPQAGWNTFTAWLKPAVDTVVGWIDPIAKAFQAIGDAIRNLPKTLPDWWTQRPGWMGGTGGAQQVSFRPGQSSGSSSSGINLVSGEIEEYIRQAARLRGIAEDIAIQVALSEGGLTDPVRQSDMMYNGEREQSFGPFQLFMDGGLGNSALAAGIDPRKAEDWQRAIDFALDQAAKGGWGPWHGAARVGIGDWEGLSGARPAGITAPKMDTGAMERYTLSTQNVTAAQLQLADSSGVVQQAQAQADAATAKSQAGLEQIMVPTAQLTEAQAAAAAQSQAFAAQAQLLKDTLAGQAPATTTAAAALTAMGAAIGPIERQVAAGAISADTLQFKLLDLARATGLNTDAWAAFDSGALSSTAAMEQLIRSSAGLGPQFQAIAAYLDTAGASQTEAALRFLQAIVTYKKVEPALTAVGDATAATATEAGTATTALAGLDKQFVDIKKPIDEATKQVDAFQTAVAALDAGPVREQSSAWANLAEVLRDAASALEQMTGGAGWDPLNIQGRAGGGPTVPNGLTLVGENGPEILGPTQGFIMNAAQSAAALSGGGGGSGRSSGGSGGGLEDLVAAWTAAFEQMQLVYDTFWANYFAVEPAMEAAAIALWTSFTGLYAALWQNIYATMDLASVEFWALWTEAEIARQATALEAWTSFTTQMSDAWTAAFATMTTGTFGADLIAAIGDIQAAWDDLASTIGQTNIGQIMGQSFSGITGAIQPALSAILAVQSAVENLYQYLSSHTFTIKVQAPQIPSFQGFASGGRPPLGVPVIVGEKGPELFVPKIDGTLMSAAETRRILAMGNVNEGPVAASVFASGGVSSGTGGGSKGPTIVNHYYLYRVEGSLIAEKELNARIAKANDVNARSGRQGVR